MLFMEPEGSYLALYHILSQVNPVYIIILYTYISHMVLSLKFFRKKFSMPFSYLSQIHPPQFDHLIMFGEECKF
jgi:hypothetical protein